MLLSGAAFAVSSSAMPFLKALMPPAKSLIRPEILPRPNSSITTTTTISQCQILNEPIRSPPPRDGLSLPPMLFGKLGGTHGKDKSNWTRQDRARGAFALTINGLAGAALSQIRRCSQDQQ